MIYDQKLIDKNKKQQKNDKYLRMGHQTHKSQNNKYQKHQNQHFEDTS